jgi:hypothetical protein
VPLYESEPTLESAARRIIQIEIYRNGWLGQERKSQERTVFDKFNRYGSASIVFSISTFSCNSNQMNFKIFSVRLVER